MQQLFTVIIVRLLNPIIGRWLGEKTGKKLSGEQISQIRSKKYPTWYDIPYMFLVFGFLGIAIGLFMITLDILPKFYTAYHHLIPDAKMPRSVVLICLGMFFLYIFWAGLLYFNIVLKLVPKRFYDYLLMQQVKGGYPFTLEDSMSIFLKLSIILAAIILPLNVLLFIFF
jgi:hypothetical protein